jgi:hypothetical protein
MRLPCGLPGNPLEVIQAEGSGSRRFSLAGDADFREVLHHDIGAAAPQGFSFPPVRAIPMTNPNLPARPAWTPETASSITTARSGLTCSLPGGLEENIRGRFAGNSQLFRIHSVHPNVEKIRKMTESRIMAQLLLDEITAVFRPCFLALWIKSTVDSYDLHALLPDPLQKIRIFAFAQT